MKPITPQFKKEKVIYLLLIILLGTTKLIAQNASTGGAYDFYKNNASWSWTVDNNNNENPGYYRWWTDGGDNLHEMAMQLAVGGSRKLTIRGHSGNGILELLAGQDDQEYGNPYLLFSQTSSTNSRAAIFMDGWNMLTFSNNSDNTYNEGFRFVNGAGKTYPILNAEENAGTELMRITKEGKVGIRTTNPITELDVNGALKLKNSELSEISPAQEGIIYYDRNFYSEEEGGQGFFEKDGGGLVLLNQDDGWSALIDTKNMDNLNATFRSLNIEAATPITSGAYKYDINFKSGDLGYKIGTGLVTGTSNSTKMDIAINTLHNNDDSNYRRAVEFISDPNANRIDTYFNRNVYAGESFANKGTDDLKLGLGAGKDIPNDTQGTHVFIGKDAGKKSGFEAITVIDYSDSEDTNPITGTEYLDHNSVFVLNNHEDLTRPLLFGNFAHHDDPNSMAQLAINTHHVLDSVALTVSGSVHIGPKNMNPTTFPSKKGYSDALLWVEKGIVTEDVIYAFTTDWDDWPDYAFENNYDLMNLSDLETYIHKEKHLPGVISKDEVEKKGLQSREMLATLLLKIEELTLYTIDQEKKIEAQKQQNKTLLKRLNAIEKRLKSNL